MPIPTPFHERTSQLCHSMFYKDWAGYYTVRSYDTHHDAEYYAFRNACGLIDVTPLFKYEFRGPDAARLLSRILVRNVAKMKKNQVAYTCWCDDAGKIIDDGTVMRLDKEVFRVTAAEPSLTWFDRFRRGMDVSIEDITARIGALALQGPQSRNLLNAATDGAIYDLAFFRMMETKIDGHTVTVTRTGYTGDLGYEIWVDADNAIPVYTALEAHGKNYGMLPCGLDALDVVRVEAGFIMNGVDYNSAHHALIEARKSTPYELGLGWTVQLNRKPFNGRDALREEKANGSDWSLAGIVLDYPDYERICAKYGLPPSICTSAWRTSIPIYNAAGTQIGYASSGAWSPILKKNLALAHLHTPYAKEGTEVHMEVTVEHTRHRCKAVVSKTPFFDPQRKRSQA